MLFPGWERALCWPFQPSCSMWSRPEWKANPKLRRCQLPTRCLHTHTPLRCCVSCSQMVHWGWESEAGRQYVCVLLGKRGLVCCVQTFTCLTFHKQQNKMSLNWTSLFLCQECLDPAVVYLLPASFLVGSPLSRALSEVLPVAPTCLPSHQPPWTSLVGMGLLSI